MQVVLNVFYGSPYFKRDYFDINSLQFISKKIQTNQFLIPILRVVSNWQLLKNLFLWYWYDFNFCFELNWAMKWKQINNTYRRFILGIKNSRLHIVAIILNWLTMFSNIKISDRIDIRESASIKSSVYVNIIRWIYFQ